MSDLAEFLLARITEDEAVARANTDHAEYSRWDMWSVERANDRAFLVRQAPPAGRKSRRLDVHHHDIYLLDQLARWDPARVLAECEAKKELVKRHAAQQWEADDIRCSVCSTSYTGDWLASAWEDRTGAEWPCLTLRILAQPYADHPDYRQEWR